MADEEEKESKWENHVDVQTAWSQISISGSCPSAKVDVWGIRKGPVQVGVCSSQWSENHVRKTAQCVS